MPSRRSLGSIALLAIFAVTLLVAGTRAAGQTETVLYSFNPSAKRGNNPNAGLIGDSAGNLYGTTYSGGAYDWGTVFELTPKVGGGWTERVLHSFNNNGKDGYEPVASLIFDSAGSLYGTTLYGGAYALGAVFELTPTSGGGWVEKILHDFNPHSADGLEPFGSLIFDAAGNLYGTTVAGGFHGYGSVFELVAPTGGGWTEKILHSFNNNGKDGYFSYAGLVLDAAGNLYGTTADGGIGACNVSGMPGCGIVFELKPRVGGGWTEMVVHNFGNGSDGQQPFASLIFDATGNLYGTTGFGGAYNYGVVFQLKPPAGGGWTENVLHTFNNDGTDGFLPRSGSLVFDAARNLYGTTSEGGASVAGTAFELTATTSGTWTEKILHNFSNNGADGVTPDAGLILDPAGNLYGTTELGGAYNDGTVFEITP